MNRKNYFLSLCALLMLSTVAVVYASQPQAPQEDKSTVLTLDQFEESISPDPLDLELDQQLNWKSEIDAAQSQSSIKSDVAEATVDTAQPIAEQPEKDPGAAIVDFSTLQEEIKLPSELQRAPSTVRIIQGISPTKTADAIKKEAEEKKVADTNEPSIEFHFEDADLDNLLTYIADLYDVTFITADALNPLPKNSKAIKGNKISFKTHKPLTKEQAWNLFLSFLDIAGFAVVPEFNPKFLKIIQTEAARKAPIPAYIGVRSETLPDNDQMIRYVYFVENAPLTTMKDIVDSLRSPASALIVLNEVNGFVLTDKSYNIRSLMRIVNELDRVSLPQSMSILKLRRADAAEVKKLFDSITQTEDATITARTFPARKQPTTLFFPENTRVIAEPRTNSLILLGAQDAIKKIEDFIVNYVDVELGKMYSPLRVYQLKFADATTIANIMNDLVRFGQDTPAGQVGGVRDEDKYLKKMAFTPEKETNALVIRGDEEDFLKAKEVIELLDTPQPQIALEVLIVNIDLSETKRLGAQIRSKDPGIDGFLGSNVKFQTSGLNVAESGPSGIVTNGNPGVNKLLGNLINLATGATAGNTLVSLGSDAFGVWGILAVLETFSNTQVLSNPFLVTTNKKTASVSLGETRRVISGTVVGGSGDNFSRADDNASLTVKATPQINSDGMIILDLDITIDTFTNQVDFSDARKTTKKVVTKAILADKEVLALGGLVQSKINNSVSKVPILGNIPILGWFFKNKEKSEIKSSLLILISPRVIEPFKFQSESVYTMKHLNEYKEDALMENEPSDLRDPIHRFFFADHINSAEKIVDDFLFNRQESRRQKRRRARAKKRDREFDITQKMPNASKTLIANASQGTTRSSV